MVVMRKWRECAIWLGIAWSCVLIANAVMLLPNSTHAMLRYLDARNFLRLDKPHEALIAMNEAAALYPFNPEHRRNMMVPVTRLAMMGSVLELDMAARAYAVSVSASGYDQNTLAVWLMWLAIAGHGTSEAYRSARSRIAHVNPLLAEPFETDAFIFAHHGDWANARTAVINMGQRAVTNAMRQRATELIGALDAETRDQS